MWIPKKLMEPLIRSKISVLMARVHTNINILGVVDVFTYSTVTDALAQVLHVRLAERGAFEARLRHLRNIGVPATARPGSGKRLPYSKEHACQILVALLLQSLGCAPRTAARGAGAAAPFIARSRRDPDAFLVLLPRERFLVVATPNIPNLLGSEPVCALINLSHAMSELELLLPNEAPAPKPPPNVRSSKSAS